MPRLSRIWIAALCFVLVVIAGAVRGDESGATADHGRVWHVSPEGDDDADGAAERPLQTLRAALQRAAEGDTIQLAAGEYVGGVKTQRSGIVLQGPADAIVRGPENRRVIEVLHDRTVLRGVTIEQGDIGVWLFGVRDCRLDDLTLRDIGGEGVRIKNGSCHNVVRRCRFERMGRVGFDAERGRKNGEGVYIGTAPEQRAKNKPPDVPDRCTGNVVEDCEFRTEAAEAVDIKEDSEGNTVRRCRGVDSRDPDGAIFGSRGDRNRFEACVAEGGTGHGFRFGGDTVAKGQFGQPEERTYGRENVMRNCRAAGNALWGAAPMVQPQDIDGSNVFEGNGKGDVRT